MDTIKGRFAIGLWDEESEAFQRDFEMRLATLEDTEKALEETPEDASTARIRRHEWAGLASVEYGILADAQERLVKKLSGGKSASPMSV